MGLSRGYERFLRNANPKLVMNQIEYMNCKANANAYVNSVMVELEKDEASLIKMTRPGYRAWIAACYFLGTLSMLISSFARKDDISLMLPTLVIAGVLLILGITAVGTINKKAKYAPKNLEELKVLIKAYIAFQLPSIQKSNNHDEYRHFIEMVNMSGFQEIYDRTRNLHSEQV